MSFVIGGTAADLLSSSLDKLILVSHAEEMLISSEIAASCLLFFFVDMFVVDDSEEMWDSPESSSSLLIRGGTGLARPKTILVLLCGLGSTSVSSSSLLSAGLLVSFTGLLTYFLGFFTVLTIISLLLELVMFGCSSSDSLLREDLAVW